MKHANTLLQQAADFLGSIRDDSALQDELRRRQHDRYRALRVLHRFQRYRRGAGSYTDIGYTNAEIGRAIDFAIRELRSHFRQEKASPSLSSVAGAASAETAPAAHPCIPQPFSAGNTPLPPNADDNAPTAYIDGTGYHPY